LFFISQTKNFLFCFVRTKVFPPTFRELGPPALELFDLDDQFSSERVRLAQLTNKCLRRCSFEQSKTNKLKHPLCFPGNDDDLEYYIREAGAILGVSVRVDPAKRDAKHILEHIFRQVVDFKKSSTE
jgi:intraflagellar transport protein 52